MIARIALVKNVLVKNVAVNDTFGESGTPAELMEKYFTAEIKIFKLPKQA